MPEYTIVLEGGQCADLFDLEDGPLFVIANSDPEY